MGDAMEIYYFQYSWYLLYPELHWYLYYSKLALYLKKPSVI